MAYVAYALGMDLQELIFVRADGKTLIPRVLNFSNSLWNPYVQSGHFSLLEPQYQSFYPLAYFLKFKANAFTFNLFLLVNIALTGFCLFLYLREINLNACASILGGMSFMLSGFVAGHKMHTTLVSAVAWIPLILMFLERSFKDEPRRSLHLAYGAFAFALVTLAGYPAMVVYGAMVVSGYALLRLSFGAEFRDRSAFDRVRLLCESLLLTFIPGSLLGAVAILPSLESLPLISRAEISFRYFSSPGWTVDAWPMVLFPFFYGNSPHAMEIYPSPYWGPVNLWEMSSFIGILPFALFLYTVLIRRELSEAKIWIALFFAGICLVGGNEDPPVIRVASVLAKHFAWSGAYNLAVFLLLGLSASILWRWSKRMPRRPLRWGVLGVVFIVFLGSPILYRMLYVVPVLNLFGVPARHLFEVDLAMAVLAGIGFNHLSEDRSDPQRVERLSKRIGAVVGVLGAAFVGLYYLVVLPRIKKIMPTYPDVGLHLIVPITAIAVTILALTLLPSFRDSKWFRGAVVVFVFLDLLSFSRFHYIYPVSINPPWDCVMIESLERDHANFKVSTNDREGMCNLFGIQGNNPVWFKHYVNMVDFRYSSSIWDNPRLFESSSMLRVLSVKYLTTTKDFRIQHPLPPEFEVIEERGDEALSVNRRFLPRIRFVSRLRRVADFKEAKDILYSSDFDPADVALLTDGRDRVVDRGEIIESRFENDSIRIKAHTGNESFLVFSDSWHPGWRVRVDEKPVDLAKPYAFQMGANISGQGEHLIEFRFEPKGYVVGKWVSLVTLGLMAGWVFFRWYRPAKVKLRVGGGTT